MPCSGITAAVNSPQQTGDDTVSLPAVRRRYTFPSADLVTLNASIDQLIDDVFALAHRGRVNLKRQLEEGRTNIIVLGFPRSGNTFLIAWLREAVPPAVNVVDGRSTHSALDIHRIAGAGLTVVIPARPPIDACASMMLRSGRFDQIDYAETMLRAYRAWYITAEQALVHDSVSVITFEQIIEEPWVLAAAEPIAHLLDPEEASSVNLDQLVDQLRASLADVFGQGSDQDGVEARLMVSLPDANRARESAIARTLLIDTTLAKHLAAAEGAYGTFMASALGQGRFAISTTRQDSRMKSPKPPPPPQKK